LLNAWLLKKLLLQMGARASCPLEKTQDEEAAGFAFSKHGAGRSMDGLEQDAPATE
jgi:hypothetical protein